MNMTMSTTDSFKKEYQWNCNVNIIDINSNINYQLSIIN